jgi:hypothetical protein
MICLKSWMQLFHNTIFGADEYEPEMEDAEYFGEVETKVAEEVW